MDYTKLIHCHGCSKFQPVATSDVPQGHQRANATRSGTVLIPTKDQTKNLSRPEIALFWLDNPKFDFTRPMQITCPVNFEERLELCVVAGCCDLHVGNGNAVAYYLLNVGLIR